MQTMNANIKKMAANQNVSMCAAGKCPGTEGLAFTVENTPSFFLCAPKGTSTSFWGI